MKAALLVTTILASVSAQSLDAQAVCRQPSIVCSASVRPLQAMSFHRVLPHYGKWLTAAGTATFTVLGAEQHRRSRRIWDQLLDICRSAQDACDLGTNGRYLRADAESLYQTSRTYDRRANRWLLGAQASLIATAALFIIDLHPGEGPDNIPFAPVRVGLAALPGGALVEMRVRF